MFIKSRHYFVHITVVYRDEGVHEHNGLSGKADPKYPFIGGISPARNQFLFLQALYQPGDIGPGNQHLFTQFRLGYSGFTCHEQVYQGVEFRPGKPISGKMHGENIFQCFIGGCQLNQRTRRQITVRTISVLLNFYNLQS